MSKGTITKVIVLATPVLWIAWDLYAYLTDGNSATESATIYRWAFHAPGVAFLFGVLCGHLFVPQSEVIDELVKK